MRIDELACQDFKHVTIVATPTPQIDEFTTAVYSVSVVDGSVRKIAQPPQPFEGLLASPDGASFAVRATTANGPLERDLLIGDANSGDIHPVAGIPDLAVAEIHGVRNRSSGCGSSTAFETKSGAWRKA